MKKRIGILFIIFAFFGLFLVANFSLAQNFGTEEVATGLDGSLGIEAQDPRVLAGRIIQFALGFLGILAVLLIMYAGFLWMTSGGDQDKISRAKSILINGVIGLIIILSSWGLATFIIKRFSEVIGGGSGSGVVTTRPFGFTNPGAGAIGNCAVENIYPADAQKDIPRNTSILITFKEELDLSSVCVNDAGASCECDNNSCNKINPRVFRLFKRDLGDACGSSCPDVNTNISDILISFTSDKKTLVLLPKDYLGSSSGHTPYGFKISGDLRKASGASMFSGCSVKDLETSFIVSDLLDLEPPKILSGKVFPAPDNLRDVFGVGAPAVSARAELDIISCPLVFSPASLISITPSQGASSAEVTLDYKGAINNFQVLVPSDAETKAQLFNASNGALLGSADWNVEKQAIFPGYLTIKVESYSVGNLWNIIIRPEVTADTLQINNAVYTFASASVNNNIKVVDSCDSNSPSDLASQAELIQAVISGHPDVSSNVSANKINLSAKIAGLSGNSISLSSSGSNFLAIKPFSGGLNKTDLSEVLDKPDKPRNSGIQFSFSEPINPITVSGSADEVSSYLRVVNNNSSALGAGGTCSVNSDCLSYKCNSGTCVGNYLNGKFSVSSNYKSVEFLSNEECGVNACGEKIYCLPANSNLRVEVMAASLKTCSNASECATFNPFSSCSSSALSYNTCQNPDGKNYPLANILNLDGVVDTAFNSLDGNRDGFSAGPLDFYSDNNKDVAKADNFSWSFFISDEINLAPPIITYISPYQGEGKISLSAPIEVRFNKLMLNNTLRSGSVNIFNGRETFNHKLVNLRSSSPSPVGFWINPENIDSEPFDGETDLTFMNIAHSPFSESMTFSVQVGSGVKDIYQNCFKASVGPDCPDTDASCCFGVPTSELDSQGNCVF